MLTVCVDAILSLGVWTKTTQAGRHTEMSVCDIQIDGWIDR